MTGKYWKVPFPARATGRVAFLVARLKLPQQQRFLQLPPATAGNAGQIFYTLKSRLRVQG